ncbi:MAG: diacylglycerol/lipid kinase family protein [Candidatus Nanopelagicales bacterium]
MSSRRSLALVTLLLLVLGCAWALVVMFQSFPHGLISILLIALALAVAWQAIRRRGGSRALLLGIGAVLLAGAVVDVIVGNLVLDVLFIAVLAAGAVFCANRVFQLRIQLPAAPAPTHAVMFWNPHSGGGKAAAADLANEARARAIEPVELKQGDDLEQLARDAIGRGADALAAAGGDGTQAIVAGIAAEHDLPFACIPAGTRNHFALDLGVDRDDVVGALDAFVNGGERSVDLGEVNGRVFVNNVSMGLYAEAVARKGYRSAKLRTILDTAPDLIGTEPPTRELLWTGPGGKAHSSAVVILVSNNNYRLGLHLGAGTRPTIDDGLLGIAVMAGPHEEEGPDRHVRLPWRQWTSGQFQVDSDGPVPVGIDGEAAELASPLRFAIRPAALRVRIAPHHPGVSPSAAQPEGLRDGLKMLILIAIGRNPRDVFAHRAHLRRDRIRM